MPRLYFVLIVGLGDKKLICTPHKGTQRDKGQGGPQKTPCPSCSQATTGATSPSKAHLHKPGGAQGGEGRQEHKLWAQGKGHHLWAPPRAVPGQPQPCGPGVKPTTSQCQSTFGTEGVAAWGWGTHHGMQGKSIWAFGQMTYYGVLREEPKAGKGGNWVIQGGASLGK